MGYVLGRPMAHDDNKQVVQGGTSMEFVVFTTTVTNMGGNSFSEVPKSILFQTRTGASDVEFVYGTTTVANTASGGFLTLKAGKEYGFDIASSGPFYFRSASSSVSAVVIGCALL